jgi:hypothetical protein
MTLSILPKTPGKIQATGGGGVGGLWLLDMVQQP